MAGTTVKCQACGAKISDDPQRDLEDGLLDEFVKHVVHPEDPIAVAKNWYYCDPECFVSAFGGADMHPSGSASRQEEAND